MALYPNRGTDFIHAAVWLVLILTSVFLNVIVIFRHWINWQKIAPLLISVIAFTDMLMSATFIPNMYSVLVPGEVDPVSKYKGSNSTACQDVTSATFLITYRSSLCTTLLLGIHRLVVVRHPTLVLHPRSFIVPLVLSNLYIFIATTAKYSTTNIMWNPATQIAWPSGKEAGLGIGYILLTTELCAVFLGIVISATWTVALLYKHMKHVKKSPMIKHSAVTILLLTVNTLFIFVAWVAVRITMELLPARCPDNSTSCQDDTGDGKFRPSLWMSVLLWFPPLLHSVFNPLILITRSKESKPHGSSKIISAKSITQNDNHE